VLKCLRRNSTRSTQIPSPSQTIVSSLDVNAIDPA
jgi:hypothetical protein